LSNSNLNFQVDSRLATLLSQEYSSTERAIKELVDNAWDADADYLSITLPKPMSDEPIIVRSRQTDERGEAKEQLEKIA
jgi:Histidine kinase-, DNA gyrase B-, and HSP90-like ATPase